MSIFGAAKRGFGLLGKLKPKPKPTATAKPRPKTAKEKHFFHSKKVFRD